jgi:hypothetical protein
MGQLSPTLKKSENPTNLRYRKVAGFICALQQEYLVTKEEIFNQLITVAINGLAQSPHRDNGVLKGFCSLPLNDLADFWSSFSDQTKLQVINNHQDEFLSWVNSSRGEKSND